MSRTEAETKKGDKKRKHSHYDNLDDAFSSLISDPLLLVDGDMARVQNMRVGKWTQEEEEYSNHLISLFADGLLPDCEEDTTLRAYLSGKLNCKPMRITKKYVTSDYDGKLLYTPSPSRTDPNPALAATLRDSYILSIVRPKLKRSHKRKKRSISIERSETNSIIGADGDNVESYPYATDGSSSSSSYSDEDVEGQITPEDIEMIQEALGGL